MRLRKQLPLKSPLLKNRLSISLVISMLFHLFVFVSVSMYLKANPNIPKEKKFQQLEVRFSRPAPPREQAFTEKKVLTVTTPSPIKVEQPPIKITPTSPPLPSSLAATASAANEEIKGIEIPSSVPTPFQGLGRSQSSFLAPRSAQQDQARAHYQQLMEEQARQRNEFQAQSMTLHLQQLLAKTLDVQPLVKGRCKMVLPDNSENLRLQCDSSALYETISINEKSVLGLLIELRRLGRNYSGFSAEIQSGKPTVNLLNQ